MNKKNKLTNECRADFYAPPELRRYTQEAFNGGKGIWNTVSDAVGSAHNKIKLRTDPLPQTHPDSTARIAAVTQPDKPYTPIKARFTIAFGDKTDADKINTQPPAPKFVYLDEALKHSIKDLPITTDCKIPRQEFDAMEVRLGALPSPHTPSNSSKGQTGTEPSPG